MDTYDFKVGDIVQLVIKEGKINWAIDPPPEYDREPDKFYLILGVNPYGERVCLERKTDPRGYWIMACEDLRLTKSFSIDDDDIWE